MHLTGMEIRDAPPFTEWVDLEFDERVNVFIGPNASGKSALLEEIDSAFNRDSPLYLPDRMKWFNLSPPFEVRRAFVHPGVSRRHFEGRDDTARTFLSTSEDWPNMILGNNPDRDKARKPPPVVYVGPVRTGLPELSDDEAASEDDTDVSEVLGRPFSGANFKAANEKIHQKTDAMFDQEWKEDLPTGERRAYHFFQVGKIAYSCVRAICAEVLTETERPRNYVTGFSEAELDSQPLASFNEVNIHRSMGVVTADQPNFSGVRPEDRPTYSGEMGQAPLYAGFLSSGTQTTFLWIHWLAYKMLHHYEFADSWKDEPAILLIDEIENHLHPTWQRRVIPALLKHFPKLQIFATTHSPFVVAGLRAGQVHLLDRDASGVVTASANERDIIGWTTDEILRTFMGVDEPTDERTIRRAERLRELRGKESISDEEMEELEKLRQQVNEDFLSSSSPLEAQRGRYADMMVRFLQSRQSDLSQDGG